MEDIFGTKITTSVFDEMAFGEGYEPFTKILKYTLDNGKMQVDIIEYGATITSIRVPDRYGNVVDVALGYDDIKGYMAVDNNPYFGASIGRVANRIANGKFTLDDVTYFLSKNEGENSLHGGVEGFNKKLWSGCGDKEGLVFRLISPHLDQGFPGELRVEAKFTLTKDNNLIIIYSATSNMPTIVNMTNHTYFNLAGHHSGAEKLYEHNLMINAFNFTPVDDNNIPKGKIQDLYDSVLDFTKPKNVGEAIKGTAGGDGFDLNYCLNGLPNKMKLVACLEHPPTGIRMTINSNQPGVQLYTANCTKVKEGRGKGGTGYSSHCGLCLETQNYPNAINEKRFPSCVLRPSEKYEHIVSYLFTTFDLPQILDKIPSNIDSLKSSNNEDGENHDNNGKNSENNSGNDNTDGDTSKKSLKLSESNKFQCQRNIDEVNDVKECLKTIFPDFRLCDKQIDEDLHYEPLSSIPDDSKCHCESNFQNLLKECQNLMKSSNVLNEMSSWNKTSGFNHQLSSLSNKPCKLNIISNNNINRDWTIPKMVDKETDVDDLAYSNDSAAQLQLMKSLSQPKTFDQGDGI